MIAWLPFLLTAAPAFWILDRLGIGRAGAERFGLAILLGMGGATTLLFAMALCGVPLRPLPAAAALGACALLSMAVARRAIRRAAPPRPAPRNPWTPGEVLLLLVPVLLLAIAAWQAAFYPVSAMDAHSYDGRARWIVAEGTLRLSVYRELGIGGASNLTYPPLYPLALAMGYWAGAVEARPADVLYLAALLLILYAVLRDSVPRLGALAGTALLAAVPELWTHLSLGLTNVPALAYLASGALLATGIVARGKRADAGGPLPLLVPGLLFAFAAGVRSDAIVLAGAVTLALGATIRLRGGSVRDLVRTGAPLLGPAVLLTLAWQIVLGSLVGSSSAAVFRKSVLPDAGLLAGVLGSGLRLAARPGLYGPAFFLLAAALLGAAVRFRAASPEFRLHALSLLAMAVGLVLLFQQIDPSFGGGGGSYLANSLKRAMFYLLPGALVVSLLSPPVRAFVVRADAWQRS